MIAAAAALNMVVLTVKLPKELDSELRGRARSQRLSKSELVRRVLQAYLHEGTPGHKPPSAFDQVSDLVGICMGGPADLSSNPEHLAGFGSI